MGRRGRRPLQTLHFTCYFEDGQWPSLHCSFRICFGIHGRIISVPYKHFIIFVWLSEDAQRAPLLLINVVFVIVLLYGNDVGTAIGRPLILSRRSRQPIDLQRNMTFLTSKKRTIMSAFRFINTPNY